MGSERELNNIGKKPGIVISLIPIVTMLGLLLLSLTKLHWDVQIPLITASIVAACLAVFVIKKPWKEIEQGIFSSITGALQAILIACCIGIIIAAWIIGGIVPSLIYYGLMILSPKFFLVTCMLVCSIVGVATGSSWTVAGTMGVALIGIGTSMGIPAPVIAGAVISGGYFGDKMSPFSDTTNLAPAAAGTTLFAHIRHMSYTTGVSYTIALIMFAVFNLKYVSGASGSNGTVHAVMSALKASFTINPLLILPVLIIIAMIVFKIPAIPGLVVSILLGVLCAMTVQGQDIALIGNVLENGFVADTGNKMLDELLTRGGLQGMMWTISLILCSLTFGGIMYSAGMLGAIANAILKAARGTGSLILATMLTALAINVICGEQYLSILITGKMYKDEYRERGLAPQNLSRALEDCGTVTSPLIPWTTCAVAMSTYMGVATTAYLPFCFFNLINPFVGILFGFTGWTIKKIDEVDPADIVES